MNEILDEIVEITNKSVEGKESTFSFDGTGFSASNKDNYATTLTRLACNLFFSIRTPVFFSELWILTTLTSIS